MGFLIIKKLNYGQVRWVKILVKYHFQIKYIKGTDNAKADILSKKVKLQDNKKLLNIILRLNKDRKIRYNYLKLIAVYKAFILN